MEDKNENYEGTESAIGWLIATFIFAILGGWLGVFCGFYVYRNQKYKQEHRNLGLIGGVLAIVSIAFWRLLF